MKLKLSAIAVSAALAFGAASASADVAYMTGGHAYVAAGAGYGEISNYDKGNAIFQGAAGYLMYQQQLAYGGELSYNYMLRNNYKEGGSAGVHTTVKTIDVLGVGKYFFNPQFDVALKAGASYMMTATTGTNSSRTLDTYNWVPAAGVGVGYSITQNIAANLDYKYLFPAAGESHHVSYVMAGASYNF